MKNYIEELIGDRKKFNEFVYTDLDQAIIELKKRQGDSFLQKRILELFGEIPPPLQQKISAVLSRQVATPNYEIKLFLERTYDKHISPVIFEYCDDKFISANQLKRALGVMKFQDVLSEKFIRKKRNVIDFHHSDGKKFRDIKTNWGESFVDFHHSLLQRIYPNCSSFIFDGSSWFTANGKNAKEYYCHYLGLFIQNAFLFENFILEGREYDFVKKTVLPAFLETYERTGYKPLIVQLLPPSVENHEYWTCYPLNLLPFVEEKILI